jgi:protein-S-isoprenylcysteine O-methyltransferase Ste14
MSTRAKVIVSSVVLYPLLAAMMLGAAGTVRWLAGWTFLVAFSGASILLMVWLLRHDPALLEERMRAGKNQKTWDKVFLVFIYVFWLAWWIGMPLDAVRFHLTHVPLPLQLAGPPLVGASFYLFFVVFRENPFLSGVVRIQDDRGQRVISTGPYAHVRHPMYAAALLLFLGTPLWLGSLLGLAIGAGFSLLMALRAVLEERTLAQELPGYAEYRQRVRYRLIPGVW